MKRLLPLLIIALLAGLGWVLLSDNQISDVVIPSEQTTSRAPIDAQTLDEETTLARTESVQAELGRIEKIGFGRFQLAGLVLDEKDEPVPNAWVGAYSSPFPLIDFEKELAEIITPPYEFSINPIAAVYADDKGRFDLKGLPGRVLYLSARAPQRLTQRRARLIPAQLEKGEVFEVRTVAAASLSGVVTHADGTPAANAEIYVMPGLKYMLAAFRNRSIFAERVFADASGRFEMEAVPANMALMTLAIANATEAGLEDILPLRVRAEGVRNIPLAKQGSLSGRVVDAAGDGVGGASVLAIPLDLRMVLPFLTHLDEWVATTSADGQYQFRKAPLANHILVAQARMGRSGPQSVMATSGGAVAPDLVLASDKLVKGRLVDGAGKGISGARISLQSMPSDKKEEGDDQAIERQRNNLNFFLEAAKEIVPAFLPDETWAETDSKGHFKLAAWERAAVEVAVPGEPTAIFDLHIKDEETPVLIFPGSGSISGKALLTHGDSPATPLSFYLIKASRASGRSKNKKSEAPSLEAAPEDELLKLGKNEKSIYPRNSILSAATATQMFDNAEGSFRLDNLMAGDWDLQIAAEGTQAVGSQVITVRAGEETADVTLLAKVGATVRGQVVVKGTREPVPHATVSAGNDPFSGFGALLSNFTLGETPMATTDRNGFFELVGCPTGAAYLSAISQNHAAGNSEMRPLEEGEIREDALIEMTAGGGFEGTVRDRHGNPLPGHMVGGVSPDSQDFWQTSSDSEGMYRVEHLRAGSYFLVTASLNDEALFKGDMLSILMGSKLLMATVSEGQMTQLDIIDESAGACRLEGIVTRGGAPVPHASMVAMASDGGFMDMRLATARTNAQGAFVFESLAPGEYSLQIDTAKGDSKVEIVVADIPEDYREIALPEGRVLGRVELESTGQALSDLSVQLVREDPPSSPWAAMMPFGNTANGGRVVDRGDTKEDGSFEWGGVPPGRYHVKVGSNWWGADTGNNAAPMTSDSFELGFNDIKDVGVLKLQAAGSLKVSVTFPASNDSESQSFQIKARKSGSDEDAETQKSWGWRGGGQLSGLAAGDWDVELQSDGMAPIDLGTITIVAGKTHECNAAFQEGASLRLLATSGDGQMIMSAKTQVFLKDGSRADSFGRSRFGGRNRGERGVPIGSFAPGAYTVEVEWQGVVKRVPVQLSRGSSELIEVTF
ncbi:MAG: hypothetical protein HN405_05530 [Planctomycetes bacterium]|jgi:protocatechuate 3,4-dioxygenase beta subunit|nr:hypothetical protein [Planctomycetota bacterium]MBT7318081.1 hypothetical protein [Planctomycetota bacterium]